MDNIDKLRELMVLHNLNNKRLSEISGYSLTAIDKFMTDSSFKTHRRLSTRAYETITGKIDTWARGKE